MCRAYNEEENWGVGRDYDLLAPVNGVQNWEPQFLKLNWKVEKRVRPVSGMLGEKWSIELGFSPSFLFLDPMGSFWMKVLKEWFRYV